MPPKNVKLRDKFMWYSCDKCGIKLIQANMKVHEKNCGKSLNFVEDEKFYSTSFNSSIPSDADLQDVPKSHLQKYVFIPESICNFTGLIMGSNVLIDFGESKKYVRTLWTISDTFLDNIYIVSEGK